MIFIKNTKKSKLRIVFFLIVFCSIFLAGSALALDPLVPCGRAGQPLCTTCDFLVLGNNVTNFFLFYLVPAIAASLFIYAGFLILLGGGIPSRVQTGYSVFRTTAYGLMIIFLAWLIVNTVLRTVAGDDNIAEQWWKLECTETIRTPPTTAIVSTTIKAGGAPTTITPTTIAGTPTTIAGGDGTTNPPITAIIPTTLISTTIVSGAVCAHSGVNLCQSSGSCLANACQQYSNAISSAANSTSISGVDPEALIRAIMFNESSCNINARNTFIDSEGNTKESCGLMQLQPATANRFKSQCGVATNITCDWLRNSINANTSICIGAKYLKSIAGGICGNQTRNIAAGYNGGSNACLQSTNCRNDKSCDGGSIRRWECLYDDNAHQVCNAGYDETRDYAPRVLGCYNKNL